MGGFFGVASKNDCVFDLFFGTDYHSHLGTKRAGMAVYNSDTGFQRAIHNIENSPFRTKFDRDFSEMKGTLGIGCISDTDPQPLLVRSRLGSFAITTVGRINNMGALLELAFEGTATHFMEMSGGSINPTELVASLISRKSSIAEGIQYVQSLIDGSMSMLILTSKGLYAARDSMGRTPVIIGKKDGAYCASFESSAYLNLGYESFKELGPGEIDFITPDFVDMIVKPREKMKICTFLWVYFGYPTSCYEGTNVEMMRCTCGKMLAKRDTIKADTVAGIPDSGTAHAVGYANESGIPFSRPFIKYTPTWPRSFMPQQQNMRNLIAHMKLLPIDELIRGKSLMLIDDSIVRGTQTRETTEFLYKSGAKEVHIRTACPPSLFSCKYLNFSRSTSEMDLIARRVITRLEGENADKNLMLYTDPESEQYQNMVREICKELTFTTLMYQRLDDMIAAIGVDPDKLCTYCWTGKE
ncbi:MAG: amidophosphoribosyltransferase [Clostridia bacterium]|nr:amidophosphoribosyltransferase [Clostridia bacterium]